MSAPETQQSAVSPSFRLLPCISPLELKCSGAEAALFLKHCGVQLTANIC